MKVIPRRIPARLMPPVEVPSEKKLAELDPELANLYKICWEKGDHISAELVYGIRDKDPKFKEIVIASVRKRLHS